MSLQSNFVVYLLLTVHMIFFIILIVPVVNPNQPSVVLV